MTGPAPWMIRERNAILANVAGWLLLALTAPMFIVSHAQHVRPMPAHKPKG